MSHLPYLTGDDVARHLTPVVAIDALQAALTAGFDPETDPPRRFVSLEGGDLIMMPSELGGHLAVKLVTIGGDPRVQGVVVVFSSETLAPVAVIDGIALTNVRTSAVSALAVRHLASADASRLLIFGRGPQAHAHVEAISAIRPIAHVDLVGREAGGAPELVAAADVICCCTTSSTPLFDGSLVRDGAVVVAIGTHDADARETDDALVSRASVIVESRTSALREAGDVVCAIESGALSADALVTLSELVRGNAEIGSGPRLFKSSGMSWEDAVMAGKLTTLLR
ncbi:ornithine cyclodeaminase family protein [Solirubrobacter ginsenosidimutans]|uniref:Ornithine cyclodeaminase family protein n=1 Tax=Solirubrobacter ginsenosidimutans TaxID=490573 RepID=A0A9X3MR77_9ACTN|nr:ornithine cyclodeaminase family protein [Solirubrobacter ginsenosidimutans]MDA0160990.1 ornithine cyclodeaminase family protein [Solirubrobacter ginsenosidimutans]